MDLTLITDNLKAFWALVVDVWQQGLFGVQIGKLITAALIFILFLALRKFFGHSIIRRLKKLAKKTKIEFDDKIVDAIEPPTMMVPVVLGLFLALKYLDVGGTIGDIGAKLVRSLIIYIILWGFYCLVTPFRFLFDRVAVVFSSAMRDWLLKVIKIALVFIAIATVLEIWGIKVGPVLAGLGLFGVAVALGAQDLFKNLISGLLIISEKRFNIGDWILVDGVVEGTVEHLGFRSTLVRRFDKAPVYVPNAKLADLAVTNFSAMTFRRIYWHIGVEYRTTIEQLRRIRDRIEAYLFNNDEFVKPSEASTFVRIDRFSDSSIDIMLYCFTRTTIWGQWLEIKERLALEVKKIVEGEGSSFAFPSRSIYMSNPTNDMPEVFVPPENP
ncbi:MAG: mechanosensitive ion channel family protein [Deltaproteobacteria bacterium]|nr:mechanosensitive ion channel family protein [Deltaproteobacteria bacterium]